MESAFDNLENAINNLAKKYQGGEIDVYCDDSAKEYQEKYDSAISMTQEYLKIIRDQLKQETTTRDDTFSHFNNSNNSGTDTSNSYKADNTLRPPLINSDFSAVRVTQWVEQFKAFWAASRFENAPQQVQQQYFLAFLEGDLKTRIQVQMSGLTRVMDEEDGGIFLIRQEFQLKYPIFSTRIDFFSLEQKEDESSLSFSARLEETGAEAALHELTVEEIMMHRIIEGLRDTVIRDRLLKLQDKTKKTFIEEMRLYDSACSNVTKLEGQRINKTHGKGGTITEEEMWEKHLCFRCGSDQHYADNCKYINSICRKCNRKGHLEKVCMGKQGLKYDKKKHQNRKKKPNYNRNTTTQDEEEEEYENDSRCSSPYGSVRSSYGRDSDDEENKTSSIKCFATSNGRKPVPMIKMKFNPMDNHGTPFEHEAMCDSGSERSIFPYHLIKKYGLKTKESTEKILAANESRVDCSGRIDIYVENDKHGAKINALVSKDVNTILISWHDMINLGVLHPEFPNACYKTSEETFNQDRYNKLLTEYKDVLCDELSNRPIKGPKMHLDIDPKVTPKKFLRARPIPKNFEKKAREFIDNMIEKDIIGKLEEPSDWLSPGMFLIKPNGELRLVVDFTISGLNGALKRNVHPFPSSKQIMENIGPDEKWFLTADCPHGYFQIALDEESQKATAFLLPFGSYYFKRSPLGLSPSGDEFCERTDEAIHGLEGTQKIVDDVLIGAATPKILLDRFEQLLRRCREHQITLSIKKLKVGKAVKFAGFMVTENGISPSPDRIEALKKFPEPKDVSAVRSFLGLSQQMASFVPDLAQVTAPLRGLLKKDTAFVWLQEHQNSFEKTKEILISDLIVKPFDPNLQTELLTDASKLHGLGYALMQIGPDGKRRLIQCGSRSLNKHENNYAVIELECLAIQWAILKARHFLLGTKFKVLTDHRPLVGIFGKSLDNIPNTRIQRFRLKLMDYRFTVEWRSGKTNMIADALSRFPVFKENENTDMENQSSNPTLIFALYEDPNLSNIHEAAQNDKDYLEIIEAINNGKNIKNLPPAHPAKLYGNIFNELSVQDGIIIRNDSQIIVPKAERNHILDLIHIPHCGITKTKEQQRQLYYWPQIGKDIERICSQCEECQKYQQSQQKEPLLYTTPFKPMSHISMDLGQQDGNDYLIIADNYSGYIWAKKMRNYTAPMVIGQLEDCFMEYGYPLYMRSDNGPPFNSTEFKEYCRQKKIKYDPSSPYFPSSNGFAENSVKIAKNLIKKCHGNYQNFKRSLLEFRNTPRQDGYSPAQMMFGRRQRTRLPALPQAYDPIDWEIAEEKRAMGREKMKENHDKSAKSLQPLNIGQKVRLQNPLSKIWDKTGTINDVRQNGRSYEIQLKSGKNILRNRHFIKPITHFQEEQNREEITKSSDFNSKECDEMAVRRKSARIEKQKKQNSHSVQL